MMPLLDIIPEGRHISRSPSPCLSVSDVDDEDHPARCCRTRVKTPVPRSSRGSMDDELPTPDLDDKVAQLPSLPADKSGWPLPILPINGARPYSGKLTATSSRGPSRGSMDRPTTRGTLMQAKLRASEIIHGQIWRGASLEVDLTHNLQETLEFAHYRFETMREASLASREKAHRWRQEANIKKARKEKEGLLAANPAKRESIGSGWPRRLRRSLGILGAEDLQQKVLAMQEPKELSESPMLPEITSRHSGMELDFRSDSPSPKKPRSSSPSPKKGLAGKSVFFGDSPKTPKKLAFAKDTTFTKGVRFDVEDSHDDSKHDSRPQFVRMSTKEVNEEKKRIREELQAKKKAEARLTLFKNKLRQERPSALISKAQKEWQRMSEEKKAIFTNAYKVQTKEAAMLDAARLRFALREVGLGGRNKEEKQEMWNLCQEYISIFKEVDLERFCYDVVPAVRARFREMNKEHVTALFNSLAGKDKMMAVGNGQAAVEDLLGTPLMSVEARQELRRCFTEEMQEEERMRKLLDEEKANSRHESRPSMPASLAGQTRSAWGPRQSFLMQWESKATKKLSFQQFQILLQRSSERYEYKQLQRLRSIQEELDSDAQTIQDLEADIVPLHISFMHYDLDSSGSLDQIEIRNLLQEFGFLSGVPDQDAVVIKLINRAIMASAIDKPRKSKRRNAQKNSLEENDEHPEEKVEHVQIKDSLEMIEGCLDFKSCLKLVFAVREDMKSKRREYTRKFFQRLDRDHNGTLTMLEVSTLFEEMGLTPRCNRGQEEIKRLLANCDCDASGDLDFSEFEQLVQLVTEKLRSITRFREMELGLKCGFTEQQVRGYRDCFWDLDKDGSGHLDIDELRILMRILKQRITGDELRMLMGNIDVNGDGHVDFSEFLRLIHSIAAASSEEDTRRRASDVDQDEMGSPMPDSNLNTGPSSARSSMHQSLHEPTALEASAKPRLMRRGSRLAARLAEKHGEM